MAQKLASVANLGNHRHTFKLKNKIPSIGRGISCCSTLDHMFNVGWLKSLAPSTSSLQLESTADTKFVTVAKLGYKNQFSCSCSLSPSLLQVNVFTKKANANFFIYCFPLDQGLNHVTAQKA